MSITIIRVCLWFCLSVCLSVCLHDKTKTAKTKIAKLGRHRDSPSRYLAHQLILDQRSKIKVTGSQSTKGDRVAGVSYALHRVHTSKYQIILRSISILNWVVGTWWDSRWRTCWIVENLIIEPYVVLGCWLSIIIPNILINAQIMAQNRNSRLKPSAILDFQKHDFWPMGRSCFSICILNLVQKCV